MKIIHMFTVIVITVILAGCGDIVEVPSAHVGKIMGQNGYREGTIPTSKFRLDPCMSYCDKIVLLDVSDKSVNEQMKLFMPKDKLNMDFETRLTLAVKPSKYNEIFGLIPSTPLPNGDGLVDIISWETVYVTYAKQIIRAEVREFLSTYTIAQIASSRETINTLLSERLSVSINEQTPFMVRYVGLADVQYPPLILDAQENAAQRREQIQQEEAQMEISKVTLERQLQEQRLQRTIDVERSQAEAEVNAILVKSITPQYIRYRELAILEKLAESDNKVFIPIGMLDSLGAQVALGNSAK